MLKTVFFDLDGTLLPMDQEEFIRQYLACLTSAMEPEGYDPETLGKAVWTGTKAMVCNDDYEWYRNIRRRPDRRRDSGSGKAFVVLQPAVEHALRRTAVGRQMVVRP